jgi:4-amino-4-deoxy-L-arabinose transferase-like glycosyltransferase
MTSKNSSPFSASRFFLFLMIFALLLKAPIMDRAPTDWDEGVLLHLSQNMTWTFGDYNTKGSVFAEKLSRNLYRASVFHHPPLVPYLIKILSIPFAPNVAAKILNVLFSLISFLLVFFISRELFDEWAAILATFFWTVCPIFNLESALVHLDLPLTVFVLAGIFFYIAYDKDRARKSRLYLSGGMFALAMLTKYTAPAFILVPFCLVFTNRENFKDKRGTIIFLLITSLGFLWWITILIRFGSLVPAEFVGIGKKGFTTPYLDSINKRQWYHVWLYFLCICPVFALYIVVGVRRLFQILFGKIAYFELEQQERNIFIINLSSIGCVIAFNVANAFTNGFWIMRHYMPFFPIIYITTSWFLVELLERRNRATFSYLLVLLFITFVSMSVSTFLTILNITQLRPIPPIFFWVPKWQSLFF